MDNSEDELVRMTIRLPKWAATYYKAYPSAGKIMRFVLVHYAAATRRGGTHYDS